VNKNGIFDQQLYIRNNLFRSNPEITETLLRNALIVLSLSRISTFQKKKM